MRTKKVKKVIINMDQVRNVLRVGGLFVVLTMANASIQALVAQTQYHLKEVQAEIQTVDQKIGWLQYELAGHLSQQQIARLTRGREEAGQREQNAQVQLSPNLVLPPNILSIDPATPLPQKTITAKIYDWVSGMGRTLAEGVFAE
ncbi:hypothetical protein [Capillibacterium thermochitinicola]|uniref:hypothetical protein n=1 Tax=Capillibacterium thermochitinicola TaxID=2699427 RepID=UPI001E659360|nr:hypothetical protein [Capillibacterium thermochitinicola]